MGIRQQLTELSNRPEGNTFEVWEEADGSITATLGGSAVVVAETNPLTGGIGISLPGRTVQNIEAKNGMWMGSMVQAWQTTFGGYCWRLATELPSHARAFRVAVPKAQQGTWTVDGIAVCSTNTAANPARFDPGAGSSWVTGTFDGSTAAKTIPQFVPPDQYQTNLPGDMVWSDWIFCPTIARTDDVNAKPIVVVSVFSASVNTMAVNGGTGADTGFETQPMHRWDAFKAAAGNATVSFSSGSSNPQCVPIAAIQWLPTVSALSIGAFSDSIMQGEKTTPRARGYVIKTAELLSGTSGYAVSSVNAAAGGDRSINSFNRFKLISQSGGGLPNIAMFAPWTRNSAATMTNEQMAGVAEAFIFTAQKYGVLPALVAGIPETSIPANNARASAVNALALSLANYYNIPYIDNAAVITADNLAAMLDVDGIHPNNTGDDALAVNAATTLSPWIATALAQQSKFVV